MSAEPYRGKTPFRATINGRGVTVYHERYEYDDGTVRPRVIEVKRRPPPPGNLGFYRWRVP